VTITSAEMAERKVMMNEVICQKAIELDKEEISSLSAQWEKENITYGYVACSPGLLFEYSAFCAKINNKCIGYLFGKKIIAENICVFPDGSSYFEIEDFYIKPEFRNQGIGKQLYEFVEQTLKQEGTQGILLSSATKNYKKIQEFYTSQVGLKVWTMTFYKII
jgi:ribosomal protein S18 acetylase RimI-like enzyme